ncbi:hypothetical protein DMH17_11840 [Raoultella planticola]|nr:hypothetical protein [Raoultella planticola]
MGLALTGTGFYSFAGAYLLWSGWNFLYLPLLQQHSVLLKKGLAQAAKPICQRYRLWQIGLVCFESS